MARRRRSHKRRRSLALRNPFSVKSILSTPKEMISKSYLVEAGATAAGFVLPTIVMGYVPPTFKDSPIKFYGTKVATIVGLSLAAGMVNKRYSRLVLVGGGASLLIDLWTEWRARSMAAAAPAPAAGTKAYYGPGINDGGYLPGVDAYYGETMNRNLSDDMVMSGDDTAF